MDEPVVAPSVNGTGISGRVGEPLIAALQRAGVLAKALRDPDVGRGMNAMLGFLREPV